jgi:hypothetical protein
VSRDTSCLSPLLRNVLVTPVVFLLCLGMCIVHLSPLLRTVSYDTSSLPLSRDFSLLKLFAFGNYLSSSVEECFPVETICFVQDLEVSP